YGPYVLYVIVVISFVFRRPPTSRIFPYTTLFRSRCRGGDPHVFRGVVARASASGRGCLARASADCPRQRQQAKSGVCEQTLRDRDRKSTRLNSSHVKISYAVFCLKKKIDLKCEVM